MITATCPECKQLVNLVSIPEIGQQLICVNCNSYLEVTWLFPVILDYLDDDPKPISESDEILE